MSEIIHEYTDEIVCPYCGHADTDSCEWGPTGGEYDGESECGECEKTFRCSRRLDVSYCTAKIEDA